MVPVWYLFCAALISLLTGGQGHAPQLREYKPSGFHIDSVKFSDFFLAAHASNETAGDDSSTGTSQQGTVGCGDNSGTRCCTAGIALAPGTYKVAADAQSGFHLYMRCSRGRQTPFVVDFTGVFFYFTVWGCLCLVCIVARHHAPWMP